MSNQPALAAQRQATTVLTPHTGEFQRLFPNMPDPKHDRVLAVREAAAQAGAVVLLKGARTAIASPQGLVWINPESTPALARGGSGDVLTGLLGGLLAQAATKQIAVEDIVATAAWWHSQADAGLSVEAEGILSPDNQQDWSANILRKLFGLAGQDI